MSSRRKASSTRVAQAGAPAAWWRPALAGRGMRSPLSGWTVRPRATRGWRRLVSAADGFRPHRLHGDGRAGEALLEEAAVGQQAVDVAALEILGDFVELGV